MNPVGGWAFGYVAGKFLMKFGRKNMMFWSIIVSAITSLAMGWGYLLKDYPNWFMTVSMASRFFMGMGRSGYVSTAFAYAPIIWPNQIARKISIIETAAGIY